ncbi:MAG: hypothetical protein KF729_32440 [Sandaracinaceae bacterium]|nr:hypothetical protein [Sandaracinaceae bacterium]
MGLLAISVPAAAEPPAIEAPRAALGDRWTVELPEGSRLWPGRLDPSVPPHDQYAVVLPSDQSVDPSGDVLFYETAIVGPIDRRGAPWLLDLDSSRPPAGGVPSHGPCSLVDEGFASSGFRHAFFACRDSVGTVLVAAVEHPDRRVLAVTAPGGEAALRGAVASLRPLEVGSAPVEVGYAVLRPVPEHPMACWTASRGRACGADIWCAELAPAGQREIQLSVSLTARGGSALPNDKVVFRGRPVRAHIDRERYTLSLSMHPACVPAEEGQGYDLLAQAASPASFERLRGLLATAGPAGWAVGRCALQQSPRLKATGGRDEGGQAWARIALVSLVAGCLVGVAGWWALRRRGTLGSG